MPSYKKYFCNVSHKLTDKHYVKEYFINDSRIYERCASRIKFFEEKSVNSLILPEMTWLYTGDKLTQKMSYIKGGSPKKYITRAKLEKFSHELDRLDLFQHPHGDICRKNIIEDNNSLFLIDIEPILEYRIKEGYYFASTPSCIHKQDLTDRKITLRSDLLGFGCFALWSFGGNDLREFAKNNDFFRVIENIYAQPKPFNTMYKMIENLVK